MSLLSFLHDSFNQLAKSLKLISIHNLLESHAPSPRKTARTATAGQNSGDIKNIIYRNG